MMKRLLMLTACSLVLTSCQVANTETATAPSATTAPGMSARPKNYVALPGQAASASETTSAIDAYAQRGQQSTAPIAEPRPIADPAAGLLSTGPVTPASEAPYALQIVNGTDGKLFIEAIDDSGNIFPFGFMYHGQRINAQPQEPRPITGHLTIIVRDPDRANAPELRRFLITPPQGYLGHTLGITVLPGGRYRVAIDNQVVYSYPEQGAEAQ